MFAAAVCYQIQALAQNDSCEDEEVDFPITFIQFDKRCFSNSECGPGEYCESSPGFGDSPNLEGPSCADFTAEFLDDCNIPDGPLMLSPGCKRNAGIECDAQYTGVRDKSFHRGKLVSAMCRKQIGESCTSDNDCIGGWSQNPSILCIDGKCQEYGYVEDCNGEGDSCSGGQVCRRKDRSQWIDESAATWACFNRADRGEKCKRSDPSARDTFAKEMTKLITSFCVNHRPRLRKTSP